MTAHTHDPQNKAAAYVNGAMAGRTLGRFETHLLACEQCWREVQLEQEGRRVAETGRELAPAFLRDQIRALVSVSASAAPRPSRSLPKLAAAAALLVAVLLGVWLSRPTGPPEQPAQIAAATDAYRSGMTVSGPAQRLAPQLRGVGLELVTSGRIRLAGTPVDAFTYRAAGGSLLLLFVSQSAFPQANGAHPATSDMAAGWSARIDGLAVYCGSHPVNYLIVSADNAQVDQARAAVAHEPSTHT